MLKESKNTKFWFILFFAGTMIVNTFAQKKQTLPVFLNPDGHLEYTLNALGDRVPDFSYCGYNAGNSKIPNVPVAVFVPAIKGDATQPIQKAINYISHLPPDENGFRGTILLEQGTFVLHGRLNITESGIVIRGSGTGENGTTVISSGKSRETLLRIHGKKDIRLEAEDSITNTYVPVNSLKIAVSDPDNYRIGDNLFIRRPTTANWVDLLEMNEFGGETDWIGWKPGRNNIVWDRTIVGKENNFLILDAPLTTALDTTYGGGFVSKYTWEGRIFNIGIENLDLVSEFDKENAKDEDHCWMAITFENAMNCWVRQVNFKHFAGSAVAVYETSRQVTVEDCVSLEPVSEIGGQRRYTFYTTGQQTLFQRCYAEFGYHDFSTGNFAPGPNAFVQCESHLPYSFSGTTDRWASGVLFDIVNIDGQALSLKNRGQDARGAGWTAANSMLWQCSAARIDCYSPPTAANWAYGAWSQFAGNGFWYEPNSFVKPRSLYYAQLIERVGKNVVSAQSLMPAESESTSSPTPELAKELTDKSVSPPLQLKDWILSSNQRNPIPVNSKGALNIKKIKSAKTAILQKDNKISLDNGWLVANNGVLSGPTIRIQWWRGSVRPFNVAKASPHITRYVPGRTGTGLTDDLEEVTDTMASNHIVALDHHYGLWYDRRRDDHERIRRMDGEVWPPFYELPFARSGQGVAFDGLSKYDLTKPNHWYWMRLQQFANLSDKKGLVLIHQDYFQHNIIEAGAHYTDFPWRTANNINSTGFPEPPPYAGNKRIFMAEQFYDVSNTHRRELHRQYIRQCLNNFKDNTNVIQMTGEEFTGPLHFVEFWVDIIAEWEQETGKHPFIALSTTKDVQDAILNDPIRSPVVNIIDIRYWQYRSDSSLYAPIGGQNLAPRQYARLIPPGKPSFESVYKAVLEYRQKYPKKAVLYSNYLDRNQHWAVFIAGGSMAAIPEIEDNGFCFSAATMQPVKENNKDFYTLINEQGEQINYLKNVRQIKVDLNNFKGSFDPIWIDPVNGAVLKRDNSVLGGQIQTFSNPTTGEVVLWLRKK
jgi:hypothetical protein